MTRKDEGVELELACELCGDGGAWGRGLEQLFQVLINDPEVWFHVTDHQDDVLLWNRGAERISGYTRKEVVGGSQVWRWLSPTEDEGLGATFWKEGEEGYGEGVIRTREGKRKIVSWHAKVLWDREGQASGMAGLGRDITRERELQGEVQHYRRLEAGEMERHIQERTTRLERAYRDLLALTTQREQHIANIAHDLKAPLVSGMGYLDLILREGMGPLGQEIKKALEVSQRNLCRLLSLIDELLGSRKGELRFGAMELEKIVAQCWLDFKVRARKRILHLTVDIERDLPPVEGDENMIARLFTNLLSNAERFTGEDMEIHISARRIANDRVEVRLRDNGIGIPVGERELVFERFYRGAHPMGEGSGLGLFLAREILRKHDCRISAEGEEGEGTTMVFTLPLQRESERERPQKGHRRSIRVLLVDDDPEVHDLLRIILSRSGDQLISAESEREGVEMALGGRPDLIFLDVSLDGRGGVEVLEFLRSHKVTYHLPIYMLTAYSGDRAQIEAQRAGATGYITKPFSVENVRRVLDSLQEESLGAL